MFPKTLALVEEDLAYTKRLTLDLRARGIDVAAFGNCCDLLAHPASIRFDFYVLCLSPSAAEAIELLRTLRKHSEAGVLTIAGLEGAELFASVVEAGGDMHLSKPVTPSQVALAVMAVQRRAAAVLETANVWRLDRHAAKLTAPDGAIIPLSSVDLALMECFIENVGATVPRDVLRRGLGRSDDSDPNNLMHATVYRLRQRIEQATPIKVPLRSHRSVGYMFRGKLEAAH